MKYFYPIVILFILTSCNQNKIDQLEKRVNYLEQELELKKSIINNLETERKKNNEIKKYSNNEIIEIVKEHLNYYCPQADRKNYVVRQINSNTYDIRFYEIDANKRNQFRRWEVAVYRLEVLPRGEYILKWRQGGSVCY